MTGEPQAKPLYQVVEESILDQIRTGQLQTDEKIPSEYKPGSDGLPTTIEKTFVNKNKKTKVKIFK